MPSTGVDPHLIRGRFPALAGTEVFFDGPGGSQTPAEVMDAMVAYLRGSNANLGGAFPTSAESDAVIARPAPPLPTSPAASRRRSPSVRT